MGYQEGDGLSGASEGTRQGSARDQLTRLLKFASSWQQIQQHGQAVPEALGALRREREGGGQGQDLTDRLIKGSRSSQRTGEVQALSCEGLGDPTAWLDLPSSPHVRAGSGGLIHGAPPHAHAGPLRV